MGLILAAVLLLCPSAGAASDAPLVRQGGFATMDPAGAVDLAEAILSSEPLASESALDVTLLEPRDGCLLPPDLAAPLFAWSTYSDDPADAPGAWLVSLVRDDGAPLTRVLTDDLSWLPDGATWAALRAAYLDGSDTTFRVEVLAVGGWDGRTVLGRARAHLAFSRDPVGAPVFFLRKPVPFAVGQAHPERSAWLLADLSSEAEPATVLSGLPVCANCHAFSANGGLVGMDVDVDGDKGAYLLAPVAATQPEVSVDRDRIISWNDRPTPAPADYSYGLFTSLSADGRFAASTVGETSLFVRMADPAFSQLFFPVTGRIGVYETATGRQYDLPGPDDPAYVQTSPAFSPDGRTLAFARAPVDPTLVDAVQRGQVKNEPETATIAELNAKYPIHFELWTVPFAEGSGGAPKRLIGSGAGDRATSSYFPRYSPDGRWIVFVQSPTGLVLQPHSRLCIVPAGGGEARVLECNVEAMNSWHSFSPNGRWLVFAGKDRAPVTELFLAHLDAEGHASPPLRLARLSSPEHADEAAMVPEFVPASCASLERISFAFTLDGSRQAKDGNVR